MRLSSIAELRRADSSLWSAFLAGWLFRHKNNFIPCVIPNCPLLLKIPFRDFYESYVFFCESPQGWQELDFFLGQLRPVETFYDVGAYRGAYLAALKLKTNLESTVHVFDPIAGNIEAVRNICRLNGFAGVKINQQAVGRGTALAGNINSQDFMFRVGTGPVTSGLAEFPTVSLDEYVARGEPPPTLMKIDVEGFELEVLQGARGVLTRHRPRLWLEIHPDFLESQGKSAQTVLDLLGEIGYQVSFFKDYYSSTSKVSHHVWCE